MAGLTRQSMLELAGRRRWKSPPVSDNEHALRRALVCLFGRQPYVRACVSGEFVIPKHAVSAFKPFWKNRSVHGHPVSTRVTPRSEVAEKCADHLRPIESLPFSIETLKHDIIWHIRSVQICRDCQQSGRRYRAFGHGDNAPHDAVLPRGRAGDVRAADLDPFLPFGSFRVLRPLWRAEPPSDARNIACVYLRPRSVI